MSTERHPNMNICMFTCSLLRAYESACEDRGVLSREELPEIEHLIEQFLNGVEDLVDREVAVREK